MPPVHLVKTHSIQLELSVFEMFLKRWYEQDLYHFSFKDDVIALAVHILLI